jgi:glycerate-2-kinase
VSPSDELVAIFEAALRRVHAGRAVEGALETLDPSRAWTAIAAGKAAVPMAAAARHVATTGRTGLIVTRDGYGGPVDGFELRRAGHPVPDARSIGAGEAALARATALGPGDGLLFLLSGGASALLAAPVSGVSLDDLRRLTEALLERDVDIAAINTVRRRLSRIKGGGLARAAAPAPVVTWAVSDVAGDAPEAIGSGPTVADPSGRDAALEVLRRANLLDAAPEAVRAHLAAAPGGVPPDAGEYRVVARLADALEAARSEAERRGLRTRLLGRVLDCPVERAAERLASEIGEARSGGVDLLIAGGEPTVELRGSGRGGRAQQLALELALRAGGEWRALVAGTDGSDGPTDAAGAIVTPAIAGAEARAAAERNDAYPFLAGAGALLVTGPTGTNVNDVALIRIGA